MIAAALGEAGRSRARITSASAQRPGLREGAPGQSRSQGYRGVSGYVTSGLADFDVLAFLGLTEKAKPRHFCGGTSTTYLGELVHEIPEVGVAGVASVQALVPVSASDVVECFHASVDRRVLQEEEDRQHRELG